MRKSVKKISLITGLGVLLTLLGIVSAGARTSDDKPFNAAATYKSKCVACHGAKAEKKWDATKSDDECVQAILKGKKAEKPPNMPGYEAKGITADQAKALLEHMRSLKQ
jgi:mono/diheme cytochrome c family protein